MKFLILVVSFVLVSCANKNAKTDTAHAGKGKGHTKEAHHKEAAKEVKEAAPDQTDGKAVVCKNAKEERMLQVIGQGKGCELKYSKFGKVSTVASSAFGSTHCEKVLQKMRTNLEASAYKCE